MLTSMTGFGNKEGLILPFGKVNVELRSTNHKFLDVVLHLPEGFLSLEDRIKKEIEARLKRGRVTCVINIIARGVPEVFINKRLLKNYILALKNIRQEFRIKDEIRMDTLIHLPGILSLSETRMPKERIWPGLKNLVNLTLDDLVKMRKKEGRAISVYLINRTQVLQNHLKSIKKIFKKTIQEKLARLKTEEEATTFLKETDITEEIERLTFHIRNFKNKISKNGPIGKELDFITQEMQREANTIGAKASAATISLRVVEIKSQIEKIREQLQNIE